MQILSKEICIKFQSLYSRKNVVNLTSADLAHTVINVQLQYAEFKNTY